MFGSTFGSTFKRRGNTLPRADLLIYLARPNSDEYLVGEATAIGEDTYIWAYVLPASLFADVGVGPFFAAGGEPIAILATEVDAIVGINTGNILFKLIDADTQTGKLAIYDPATDASVLTKAKKVMRIT